MGIRPATSEELEAVRMARDAFRAFWASIHPVFPCSFNGTGADLDALDYLDYEGFLYPEPGEAGAALVWGHVVASQLPFDWHFDDELCGLILRSREGNLAVWPFGRVVEALRGDGRPSGSRYRVLLDWLVLQCLERRVLDDADAPWLCRLYRDGGPGWAESLGDAAERLRRLWGESPR